ncbi:MAG: helix-hairpin-helix domain-containing protein [Fimbriimonadales bacterium]|nr:helix-hairpin-helix domain-containing protein [Fimbriimonadales bacterium]
MHSIWDKLELRERTTLLAVYAASVVLALLLGYGWGRSGAEPTLQTGALQTSSAVEVIDLSQAEPQPASENAQTSPVETPQSAANDTLVVHVVGAVKKAGVYTLATGSRVVDAIEQAGGATASADLDTLNLAEPLVDGQKIYVPRKGETPSPVVAAPTAASASRPARSERAAASPRFPINLNTATAEDLEAIPGIGPTLAQRIVEYRATHGKFSSVDDLLEVHGIGQKRLENMRPYVTVK